MRGRIGKQLFNNDEDKDKFGLDNIANQGKENPKIDPLPNYDIGKDSPPTYSFPKDQRF